MDTTLEDALKNRAYQLGKNVGDLTPPQIAEVEANPLAYLPEAPTEVQAEVLAEAPEPEPVPEPESISEPEAEIGESETEAEETVPELEPKPKPRRRRSSAEA